MLELQPGQVVSGFEVKAKIGKGGMGAVYLVHDKGLGVDRALKVISLAKENLDDEEQQLARERFSREARTLARLRHNNIIPVHTVGEVAGTPFLVMTHFPSTDLRTWLNTNPSLERIVEVMKQAAGALGYAHKQGVLHRDIKLSNILINSDDELMFIDFGLAKASDDQNLTRTGRSMGTFAYMAPEYVAAAMVGHAEHTTLTDLWALGCVLYALITHRPAFADQDDVKLLGKVQKGEYVPVEKIRTDISTELRDVVHGLLTVDAKKRTQSASAFAAQLNSLPRAADPSKPPWTPPTSTSNASMPTARARGQASPPNPPPSESGISLSAMTGGVPEPSRSGLGVGPASGSAGAGGGLPKTPEMKSISLFAEVASASPAPAAASTSSGDPFAAVKHQSDLPSLSDVSRLQPPTSQPSSPPLVEVGSLVAPAPLGARGPAQSPPRSAADVAIAAEAASRAPSVSAKNELSVFSAALAGEQAPSRVAAAMPASSAAASSAPASTSPPDLPAEPPTPSVTSMPAPRFTPPPPTKPSTQGRAVRNLILPLAGAAVVLVIGAVVVNWSGKATEAATKPAGGFVDPDSVQQKRSAENELAGVERAKKDGADQDKQRQLALAAYAAQHPQSPPDAPPSSPSPTPTTPASDSPSPATTNTHVKPSGGGHPTKEAPTPTPPAPGPADEFAARYGTRTNFNTASVAGGGNPAPAAGAAAASAPTAGVRIPARLDGALSSSPPGPIIAVTTAESKVGDVVIPAGTQIHGTTQGSSGPRILASFTFAIIGGKNVPLRASALGSDGRSGIPGSKSIGGASDVVAGGAAGAVQGVGDAIAGAVGDNPVGGAVRGATSPAGSKTNKLNNEEGDVVTTKRGARFVIYVEGQR